MKLNSDYYTIEDLPMSVFEEIQETDNYSLLSKTGKEYDYEKIWCKINDAVTEIIGINEDYINFIRCLVKSASHMKMALVDGKISERTISKVFEIEAKQYLDMLKGSTITENLLDLSRFQGYHIRKEDITVQEYYILMKKYGDSDKK